ncbi:hypothetical protein [Mailhella massiliensis]|uniref:Uncharacterized protein n=1 Tax=Mailhella massiliensis TaxID=1903261 RepID=A0A921AXW3_9BACT|nr:hypothetical protein [Mailhella massiliensis]HJD98153.1 hypothetical protein [Mailhella massiliensis]
MDIGSVASSSSRLLDALERMGLSQGEGLISSGPSPVPGELARMFESLMEREQPSLQAQEVGLFPGNASGTERASSIAREGDFFRSEGVEQASGSGASPSPGMEETLISPSELYRLQFQVGMLRFQAETGSNVKQQATQGLDSLLRNQS